jgi:hypothetical protein
MPTKRRCALGHVGGGANTFRVSAGVHARDRHQNLSKYEVARTGDHLALCIYFAQDRTGATFLMQICFIKPTALCYRYRDDDGVILFAELNQGQIQRISINRLHQPSKVIYSNKTINYYEFSNCLGTSRSS